MSNINPPPHCGSCGESIDEDPSQPAGRRNPCPACGSLTRIFDVSIHETIVLREKYRMQAKHHGRGKPQIDQTSGDDLCRKTEKWMKLNRIIDRENDLYHERVVNPETGKVIHECKEPLSKHQGHGSAKIQKGKQNSK